MPILQDIAKRLLRIECPEISLARSVEPLPILRGQGTVFVDQFGQIRFKFDVCCEQYKVFVRVRAEHLRSVPERPQDGQYFELTAKSGSGQVWRGRLLSPQINNITPEGIWEGPGVAEGMVHSLTLEEEVDDTVPSYAKLAVPKRLIVPRIQRINELSEVDHCYFRFGQEKIEIFVKDNYAEIYCQVQKGGIATNRYWRMIEAIEFAIGQSIYPSGIHVQEKGKSTVTLLSSVLGIENEGQLPPPINITGRVHHFPITQLAEKFYSYVLPYTEEFPPLIAHGLWGLRQAANAQPDIKALVFSTAVETLIRSCFPNIKPVDASWRKEVGALQERIKEDQSLTPLLRDRASNKLDALTNQPNDQKIREFLHVHIRNEEEQDTVFQDWKDLGNPAAHGKKIDPRTIEDTLRQINVTLDLCYLIVRCRIGYLHPECASYAPPYWNSWSVKALNKSDPNKHPLGSLIVLSKFKWVQDKHRHTKTISLGDQPAESIKLIARSRKTGEPPFRIELCPREIIPDQIAEFQLQADYPTLLEAQKVCDQIAERALVHLTLAHLHIQ